jgi:hypothetical protein
MPMTRKPGESDQDYEARVELRRAKRRESYAKKVATDTDFVARKRASQRGRNRCKVAPRTRDRAAENARHRERMANDPEYRAKRQQKDRGTKARRRSDPERNDAYRARQRERDSSPTAKARKRARDRGNGSRLTEADLARMLEEQGGCCAVCGAFPQKGRGRGLYLDHRHDNGAVRGLICARCNRDLAALDCDFDRLFELARYQARGGHYRLIVDFEIVTTPDDSGHQEPEEGLDLVDDEPGAAD